MDLAIGVAVGSSIQIGSSPLLFAPSNESLPKNCPNSTFRHPLRRPTRLVHAKTNVPLLYPFRNRLPLRQRLHC